MTLLWLPICSLIELIKRPIFWLIYPVAYLFRHKYRSWALDDSIRNENIKDFGVDKEYCWYGKRWAFVEKYLPYDFCRSWYWGAWRNNSINLMDATERWIGSQTNKKERSQKDSYYEVRTFTSGKKLPYLQYWIGGWRLQIGFLSCGRFQQQIRKIGQ
jgi:hypothetical protein